MESVILSLCIPTYNRVNYLRELMPQLIAEVEDVNRAAVQVELLISDNATTDGTEDYLREISCRGLKVYRNAENIGGNRNFLACVERASGEYIWLFGDDEVIEPGGVGRVLKLLSSMHPALLILRADGGETDIAEEVFYPDYGACLRAEMNRNAAFALSHSLITTNVFRRDVFDLKEATSMLYTCYAHLYGLMKELRLGGRVAVKTGVFRVRPQRAPFERWPTALCVKQAGYLWRVAGWFEVPRMRRIAIRSALNLPIEILSCCAHKFFPGMFNGT